jgi:disulfide bond formation protein DsbB
MSNRRLPAAFPPLPLAAAAVGLGALTLLLGALIFEHGLGLAPCPLCLAQRGPLAAAAVLALTAAAAAPLAPGAARLPLAAAGLVLLIGAGIALYHSGIELQWWRGPESCSGSGLPGAITDLNAAMAGARIIRCDVVPWSLFGLSLANYNAIVSTALATLAGLAIWRKTP